MIKRPDESKTARLARLMGAVASYKGSVEFLPILGGKIIIPDDIEFLLGEIERLENQCDAIIEAVAGEDL